MSGRVALLLCLLLTTPVRAEVFTWTDAAGVRHYGDRPPADTTTETLELDRQALSTIGGSGIRPGERELLERAEALETARLQATAARAARGPPPVRSEVVPPPPEQRIVTYRPPSRWLYHKPRQRHWHFDLRLGRLSFHAGSFHAGSFHAGQSIGAPPYRPGHRPPHAYRPAIRRSAATGRVRPPGGTRPIPTLLSPSAR